MSDLCINTRAADKSSESEPDGRAFGALTFSLLKDLVLADVSHGRIRKWRGTFFNSSPLKDPGLPPFQTPSRLVVSSPFVSRDHQRVSPSGEWADGRHVRAP
jgi:hypothetical protein